VLDRIRQGLISLLQTRSLENPKTPLSNPDAWLFTALGASSTFSGANINERTALQISAVFACVRVIAESIGSLPLHVYQRQEPRGREKATKRREYSLLHDAPNDRMTACVFREVMTAHVLLSGNAYALIDLDGAMKTKALWPLSPSNVRVELGGDRSLRYVVRDAITNKEQSYSYESIIHIPGLSFDGVTGMSPVMLHREGIGLAQALEQFGAEYFGNGTSLSGVLQLKKVLTEDAQKRLRNNWTNQHGRPGSRHKVAIAEEGMEFKAIQQQADQAQFIQSRKFQTEEIARVYRVPLHMIGDLERSTNNNIEHQALEFVQHTLRPWLVRWEQELNRKLFPDSQYFVEHNIDGLLRGDFATRMTGFGSGRQWGWLSANDIREKEGMNPLPGEDGDQYLVPANMTTPELLANPPKPAPAPQPAMPEPEPPANRSKQEIKRYLRPMFADAIRRSLNYECKDPEKLERFVVRAFTPILLSMAEIAGTDRDVAISYAENLHTRLEGWTSEIKRENEPAPIVERELELAFNFIAAKESSA
jgi:HK97 family phage portal protein